MLQRHIHPEPDAGCHQDPDSFQVIEADALFLSQGMIPGNRNVQLFLQIALAVQ